MVQQSKAELKVSPRDVMGKKVKRLRREGLIPANVYGRGLESVSIQVTRNDLVQVMRTAGRNEIVYLRLDGDEPRPTFVRQIQRNPITDAILHVDFYQISLKEKVHMEVPLSLVGTAPAEQTHGGTVLLNIDRITVEGLPTEIPSVIEVDVSGLEEIDAAISVSELNVPAEVTLLTDPAQVVAKVAPPHVEKVEEEEEEVEAVEGEEAVEAEEGGEPAADSDEKGGG